MSCVKDVGEPEGKAWLRGIILVFLATHPGVREDRILKHVAFKTPSNYEGLTPEIYAIELLAEMAEDSKELRWGPKKKGEDDLSTPLRYWISKEGR